MAMASTIRPLIGRISSPVGSPHIANPSSFLSVFKATTRATQASQACLFSTTPELNERRPRRDNNRLRGLSSLYRSGPRARTNIDPKDLPKPMDYKPQIEVDPNHGLWDFFFSKENLLLKPDEIEDYGRSWTAEELRHKSWEDLHSLWWVCCKEQNRIVTAMRLLKTFKLKGRASLNERLHETRHTMKRIRHVLTERFYLWEDARALAATDPEIDLANTTRPYNPSTFLEDEAKDAESEQQEEGAEKLATEVEDEESKKSDAEKVEPSTIPTNASEDQQPSLKA